MCIETKIVIKLDQNGCIESASSNVDKNIKVVIVENDYSGSANFFVDKVGYLVLEASTKFDSDTTTTFC